MVSALALTALHIVSTPSSAQTSANTAELKTQALTAFRAANFTSAAGQTMAYRILLPLNFDPSKTYGLIVWLHGAGEVGDDNQTQISNGIEELMRPDVRSQLQSIVVAPQCPSRDRWSKMQFNIEETSRIMLPTPSTAAQTSFELVESLEKTYRINPKAIKLVGLSMGGVGVWDWMIRRPDLFRLGLEMSGAGDPTQAAPLNGSSIWAIHGELDPVNHIEVDQAMALSAQSAGAHLRWTTIPGGGHGPWNTIVSRPDVLSWILQN